MAPLTYPVPPQPFHCTVNFLNRPPPPQFPNDRGENDAFLASAVCVSVFQADAILKLFARLFASLAPSVQILAAKGKLWDCYYKRSNVFRRLIRLIRCGCVTDCRVGIIDCSCSQQNGCELNKGKHMFNPQFAESQNRLRCFVRKQQTKGSSVNAEVLMEFTDDKQNVLALLNFLIPNAEQNKNSPTPRTTPPDETVAERIVLINNVPFWFAASDDLIRDERRIRFISKLPPRLNFKPSAAAERKSRNLRETR